MIIKGIIRSTHEFNYVVGQCFDSCMFGNPYRGGEGMGVSTGIEYLVSELSIDEPGVVVVM